MKTVKLFASLIAALACVSCSAEINPIKISVGSIVHQRPETTVGPAINGLQLKWRVVRVFLSSAQLKKARSFNSTVHLLLSDCDGATLAIDDIYVSDLSLNEMSVMSEKEFQGLIESSSSVAAVFYLRDDLYQRERRICGSISGGGMALGSTSGISFVVK